MDTITISKEKYEELLRKADRLNKLESSQNIDNTKVDEVNEDDFDNLEVRPEYLEKLERIRKEKGIPFKNIEELRQHLEKNA